jgi:GNAT superfamily N-acetyltransferase
LIRAFEPSDAAAVRDLFIAVNRALSPPELREAFEEYITRALREEIDRIDEYYGRAFGVAVESGRIVGTFGLEAHGGAMELRRMYVEPAARRRGIATAMLARAEAEAKRRGANEIVLGTATLQAEAVALYEKAGFQLVREAEDAASHKTVGGLRRRYYRKALA